MFFPSLAGQVVASWELWLLKLISGWVWFESVLLMHICTNYSISLLLHECRTLSQWGETAASHSLSLRHATLEGVKCLFSSEWGYPAAEDRWCSALANSLHIPSNPHTTGNGMRVHAFQQGGGMQASSRVSSVGQWHTTVIWMGMATDSVTAWMTHNEHDACCTCVCRAWWLPGLTSFNKLKRHLTHWPSPFK